MRLEHEAAVIIGAGIETTMTILSVACFYILNEPEIYQQLHQELVDAWPDVAKAPTFTELERLPYLTAVIQECEHTFPCRLAPALLCLYAHFQYTKYY